MTKKIFLCAERYFPRGDAGANRVLYIAKALKMTGWTPIVISIGLMDEKYFNDIDKKYYYEGIQFCNVSCKTNGFIQKIERAALNGKRTVKLLKDHGVKEGDVVLIYSSTAKYVDSVLNYSKNIINAKVVVDVVEWHQPFQFPYGKYDPRYVSFKKCFEKLFIKAHNVISISDYLGQHFQSIGCNVLTLPIYIEPKENYTYTPNKGKLNLIYPGNPYRKDSLLIMLQAIDALSYEEKKRITLHLTGTKKEMLARSIPKHEKLLDISCVQVHGWMEYEELMELYQMVDFALIARPNNTVTLANFPSKVPELMNRGIPIIINKIGDIGKYLEDGKDSLVIEDFTVESCTNSIRRALEMHIEMREKMHENAFYTAHNYFDFRKSADLINSYMKKIK